MSVFLAVLSAIIAICLVLAAGMEPKKTQYSLSELKRRAQKSKAHEIEVWRYEARPALLTFFRILRALLLVLFVCTVIGAFGWGWGVFAALAVAVLYPSAARLSFVKNFANHLYETIEGLLLEYADRLKRIFHILREPSSDAYQAGPRRVYSPEDLTEVVHNSPEVIGENERLLLSSAMVFFGKKVNEVMTPRSVINFIKQSEFLGPLVLDELHALGNSRLPVIAEDLDHIVGILHLRDLLSLDQKRSATAEKAMEKKVFYIHQDDTLEHALAAFIKTRHHLFIVINENRETAGILSLEDVIEALIGRQIVDEDDIHADLRAVAAQEGKKNNSAPGHVDL